MKITYLSEPKHFLQSVLINFPVSLHQQDQIMEALRCSQVLKKQTSKPS